MRARVAALALTAALALAACAPQDEQAAPSPTESGTLATVSEGYLTVATSNPAYEPWVVGDDPSKGEGFEAAVAYAVAEQLGFDAEHVSWAVASFDQIIAPGAKQWDVAINQVSISDERRKNIDFSSPYYTTAQAVVTVGGSKAEKAASLADLAGVKIGAMVGTTSLTAAQEIIDPSTPVQVFNDNDQVKQALTSGLVDAVVVDLPTALYITAAELEDGVLVGQLPDSAGGDQFGLVLPLGSTLTPAVSGAVDALREDGTLADLEKTWLTAAAGAPVLS